MQERLIKRTAVFTCLFTVAAMVIMFYYSSVKVIVIAGEHTEQNQMDVAVHEESIEGEPLPLEVNEISEYLYISLPDEVTPDNISIDNHYMDKIVEIGITGIAAKYYEKEVPYGKCGEIAESTYYTKGETVYLCFSLKDTYEVEYVYETGRLAIRFVAPDTLYDNVALLDAGDAYTNEKRQDGIVKEVVADVKQRLEAQGIKVYDVSTPIGYSTDEKLDAMNKLCGDVYVSVEIDNLETEKSGMEAYYNEAFFIPFVGNITVADSVLREAAFHTGATANGLLADDGKDEILQGSQMPSARLRIGYGESKKDMDKLYDKEYRQKLAEGISAGILNCFHLKEQYESDYAHDDT